MIHNYTVSACRPILGIEPGGKGYTELPMRGILERMTIVLEPATLFLEAACYPEEGRVNRDVRYVDRPAWCELQVGPGQRVFNLTPYQLFLQWAMEAQTWSKPRAAVVSFWPYGIDLEKASLGMLPIFAVTAGETRIERCELLIQIRTAL